MERTDILAIVLACAAIPAGAALMAAPAKFPNMPQIWVDICFYGGIFLTAILLIAAVFIAAQDNRVIAAVGMIVFGGLFLLCSGWYFWPRTVSVQKETMLSDDSQREHQKLPDINIRITHPKSPTLVIDNISDQVAMQIKWSVAIWNLDDPRTYVKPSPQRNIHDPLPIPTQTFDFLRPRMSSTAQGLFNTQQSVPFVKNGQRLFGSISAVCPTCKKGITIIVYAVYGEGGWYYYDKDVTEGQLIIPVSGTTENIQEFYKSLSANIPISHRITIPDH